MKKLMNASILAMTGALIVVSCKKEEIVPVNADSQTAITQSTSESAKTDDDEFEDVLFLLNGTEEEVDIRTMDWTDETHFLYDYEGQHLAFDSDDHFLNWVHEDASRHQFLERYDYYKSEQQFAIDNGYWDDEEATDRYTQELIDAEGSEGDRITLSILFNNTSYGGSAVPVLLAYPSLGGFKNKAESMLMLVPNVGALCDKTWFRGAKFWYVAFPGGGLPTFLGFNNRADSIF